MSRIGANTTIDRGAIDDTVIEDDVKLDNQIQIGHNCSYRRAHCHCRLRRHRGQRAHRRAMRARRRRRRRRRRADRDRRPCGRQRHDARQPRRLRNLASTRGACYIVRHSNGSEMRSDLPNSTTWQSELHCSKKRAASTCRRTLPTTAPGREDLRPMHGHQRNLRIPAAPVSVPARGSRRLGRTGRYDQGPSRTCRSTRCSSTAIFREIP